MIVKARYLALKHSIFGRRQRKPYGVDLLSNLNYRHFERWSKTNDYKNKEDAFRRGDVLTLIAHTNKNVLFNWNTWDWKYEPRTLLEKMRLHREGYTQKYTHSAGRCDTKDKVIIDVYKPGRIISKCTIPQEGAVSAIWVYFEEHPKDSHHPDRDVYFELDIFESEPRKPESTESRDGLIFTHWLGKYQSDAIKETIWMFKTLTKDKFYYPELKWDGKGNFIWKLDGVTMKKVSLNLPTKMKPYVIYSLGVASDLEIKSRSLCEWSIYEK
jgi:hypothetical protein